MTKAYSQGKETTRALFQLGKDMSPTSVPSSLPVSPEVVMGYITEETIVKVVTRDKDTLKDWDLIIGL